MVLGPPHEAVPPVSVEVPGSVSMKVMGTEADVQAGGVEVTLAVESVGGRLVVGSVAVEHAADPTGPWASIGTITGDGTAYDGTVTAPAGSVGFIRVVSP